MRNKLFLVLLGLVICSPIALSQGLGSIVGTVTDPTGAAVASAKVSATQVGTGITREATSNTDGYYVIPSLPPAQKPPPISMSTTRSTRTTKS